MEKEAEIKAGDIFAREEDGEVRLYRVLMSGIKPVWDSSADWVLVTSGYGAVIVDDRNFQSEFRRVGNCKELQRLFDFYVARPELERLKKTAADEVESGLQKLHKALHDMWLGGQKGLLGATGDEMEDMVGGLMVVSREISRGLSESVFGEQETDANEFVSFKELRLMKGGVGVIGLLNMAGETIRITDEELKTIKAARKREFEETCGLERFRRRLRENS